VGTAERLPDRNQDMACLASLRLLQEQILTKTEANPWPMLYYSMAVTEVQQFSAKLFIQCLSLQWLFQGDH
jgi:hypothetical protein